MEDKEQMDNWKILLNSAQAQRLHWSAMIITLMGFVISANVLIWTYALSNYLPSLAGCPYIQQPVYIFVGAAASAISLGAWRLYTHYLDKNIVWLYPEIIYYESLLGATNNHGLSGYLIREVFNINNTEEILTKEACPEKRSEAIRKLIERNLIGDRTHKRFDIATLIIIILIVVVCLFVEYLTGYFFTGTYSGLHIMCLVFVLIGLILAVIAVGRCPNKPSQIDVKKIIAELNKN